MLHIPLSRVIEIYFANTEASNLKQSPWAVRASFPGGESVSFLLEKWTENEVTGASANFGPVAFHPRAIRYLQFNPSRVEKRAEDDADSDWIPEVDE